MSKLMLALFLASSVDSMLASAAPGDEPSRRQAAEHQRRGEQLLRSEHFEAAAREFRHAIALDPMLAIAHYDLGMASMALKLYPDAVVAYQGCADAIRRLGSLGEKEREERERQNQEEIRDLRSSIIQLQSGRFKAVSVDAMVLRAEERIRILEDSRMKGREVVRVPAGVHLGLGSAYFRQNLWDEAERAYADALREDRKLGAAHNNLAVIYMLTDRLSQARVSMEEAERAGFRVDARFRADLDARERAASLR